MKIDFDLHAHGVERLPVPLTATVHVASEVDRLTDVILCPPTHLSPVPCCAVTRASLREGFCVSPSVAIAQHEDLVRLLQAQDVRCHMLMAAADLPDMCFTRDVAVATPFGLMTLNPAMAHRRAEVDALQTACERWGIPFTPVDRGTVEGGDVCLAREGLLIVGMSGERSTRAGIEALSAPFRAAGWEVLVCPFDADHLHLDTMFCMVGPDEAIACVELLDPQFLRQVKAHGITILPVPARSSATLACNVLSLGHRRVITSTGDSDVGLALQSAGYEVLQVDISQFAACGGGIHCLTQPIRREPA